MQALTKQSLHKAMGNKKEDCDPKSYVYHEIVKRSK